MLSKRCQKKWWKRILHIRNPYNCFKCLKAGCKYSPYFYKDAVNFKKGDMND